MANLWFAIPKLIEVDRGAGNEPAVSIEQGFAQNISRNKLGIDGGFTLKEAEDLLWRLKQGVHLLKHGKLPYQHP